MSKPLKHIIHRLNLDIEAPDSRMARKLYEQAGELLQQFVLPALEELLKRYDKPDLHINLERLDINLDELNPASFEEEIKSRLASAIMNKLEEVVSAQKEEIASKEDFQFLNSAQRTVNAFLWFLEYGALPWWVIDQRGLISSSAIINAVADDESGFVGDFKKCLEHSPDALKRLLYQYDFTLLQYLISLLIPLESFSFASDFLLCYEEACNSKSDVQKIRQRYWQTVWTSVPVPEIFEIKRETLEAELSCLMDASVQDVHMDDLHFFAVNTSIEAVEAVEDKVPRSSDDKEDVVVKNNDEVLIKELDGLLGRNAGLILLHPFLQYFFLEFGLLEGDTFKHEEAQCAAVHLLHYLATGEEQAPDFELLFEKYLCGMPLTQVTNRHLKLSEAMKAEADVLLQSVIKHWSVLRNTSPEGLREGFLQRKGKLIASHNAHKIVMERNTLDILLQQIPWNISLVRLPWLDTLIHVEWNE